MDEKTDIISLPDINGSNTSIKKMIFSIRNTNVMIDRDIANLFQVETKVLNQAVKRNRKRFPNEFVFQLNDKEKEELVTKCDRFISLKHSTSNPYAFTEHGVTMLSAVLKSDIAIRINIQIVRAFVQLRKNLIQNRGIYLKIYHLEERQKDIEKQFDHILNEFNKKENIPSQGIFFDGQVFDACLFTINLIGSAKSSIILIDSYVDEQVVSMLSKKHDGVGVRIYTSTLSDHVQLSVRRFNEQYGGLEVRTFRRSHDRFLIIDEKEIYHIGASLKDLGKKWFAFTRLRIPPDMILEQLR